MEMCNVKVAHALDTTFSALVAAENDWAKTAGRRGSIGGSGSSGSGGGGGGACQGGGRIGISRHGWVDALVRGCNNDCFRLLFVAVRTGVRPAGRIACRTNSRSPEG